MEAIVGDKWRAMCLVSCHVTALARMTVGVQVVSRCLVRYSDSSSGEKQVD